MSKQIEGFCAGCSDPIPLGALITVGKYETVEWAPNFKVQKPKVIYCQKCKHLATDNKHYSHRVHRSTPDPEPQKPSATRSDVQQMAIALYKAASKQSGNAKQLAQKAGIEYSKVVELILKKLAEKKKLKNKDGVWMKA